MSNSLLPHGLQHSRLPCPSPSTRVCSNFALPMYPFFFIISIYLILFLTMLGLHADRRLSLVVVSKGYPSLRCSGFSSWCFSCCGTCALGVCAQKLWYVGFVAMQHVESSWSRDWTHVPCIIRQTLNHCATREFFPLTLNLASSLQWNYSRQSPVTSISLNSVEYSFLLYSLFFIYLLLLISLFPQFI